MISEDLKLEPDDLKMVTGGAYNHNENNNDDGIKVSCRMCGEVFTVPFGTRTAHCPVCGKPIDVSSR